MHIVEIVADRFAVATDRRAIDLATGALVELRVGVGGGAAEQARWSIRCDGFLNVRHPALAALVDYGAVGESCRFEAWRCDAGWRGGAAEAARTIRAASQYLRACGLTGGVAAADLHEVDGHAAVVPNEKAGYAMDTAMPTDDAHSPARDKPDAIGPDNCAVCLIERRADAAVADLFATIGGSRPHVVSIWGPSRSGRTTAALCAARIARLSGFVPIGVRLFNQIDGGLVRDRHLCLISDDNADAVGARWGALLSLLSASLASPRIHILLRIGRDELRGVDGVGLEAIPPGVLAAAVKPAGLGAGALSRIGRAAAIARGSPGQFVEQLWRRGASAAPGSSRSRGSALPRVAEQSLPYNVTPRAEAPAWAAPGEVAALRLRSEAAVALLKKGRHEPGIRQLRQAIGGLSRRGDWAHAGNALLALASALLVRGEARAALAALDEARACAEQTGGEATLIDAAVLSGHAWIDLARLDEAESVAGTALTVARRAGDIGRGLSASLALGRCLFWKGQYADARSVLVLPAGHAVGPCVAIATLSAAARAAIGMKDVSGAMALLREAMEGASRQGDPALLARALCAAAFVHLAVGDLDAVAADVSACLGAARAAHEPMRAVRARLLRAENDRRRGRMSFSASFLRRVRTLDSMHLPPIIRARADLVQALVDAPESHGDTVTRHAGRSGLAALSLFVAGANHGPVPGRLMDAAAEGLVGILDLCQTAEDEGRVLAGVCARLRKELHAASIGVFLGGASGLTLAAADGGRLDAGVAVRAVTSGIAVAPHLLNDRLESAVPVRYGGSVIGAFAARWALGAPYDLSRAAAVLTMAAAAAAPVVSAAVERRSRAPAPAAADLLGMAGAMSELRRAIERAAPAPFAVLIEGESGSGKELVAKAIHRSGFRRDRPFCTLNCAALPDDLIEAELFGHARGAFTGAVNERAGVFEEAHGGTLFLDEVGELSPRAQAKLLRVIQEGELRRIGENLSRRVDVRILSATNRDLRQEVTARQFRLDLLYRLDVIRLVVPPLRDRREDIPVLADHFWREATSRLGSRAILGVSTTAALARYDWPGNVRELQNVLAALAVRSPRRGVVPPEALPPQFGGPRGVQGCRLDDARRTFEEHFVRAALARTGGHRGRAATELGVTRQGLTKLMTRLGISDRCSAPIE